MEYNVSYTILRPKQFDGFIDEKVIEANSMQDAVQKAYAQMDTKKYSDIFSITKKTYVDSFFEDKKIDKTITITFGENHYDFFTPSYSGTGFECRTFVNGSGEDLFVLCDTSAGFSRQLMITSHNKETLIDFKKALCKGKDFKLTHEIDGSWNIIIDADCKNTVEKLVQTINSFA